MHTADWRLARVINYRTVCDVTWTRRSGGPAQLASLLSEACACTALRPSSPSLQLCIAVRPVIANLSQMPAKKAPSRLCS